MSQEKVLFEVMFEQRDEGTNPLDIWGRVCQTKGTAGAKALR